MANMEANDLHPVGLLRDRMAMAVRQGLSGEIRLRVRYVKGKQQGTQIEFIENYPAASDQVQLTE